MSTQPLIPKKHQSVLEKPFLQSSHLKILLEKIHKAGGHGILVGGCVRDHLLGRIAKDIDIEVYGISALELEEALKADFLVNLVGKAFGIFKVVVTIEDERQSFDVALPRNENKAGFGHKGFVITTNPHMTFIEAASRRDFTINAMGIDPSSNTLLDPYDGHIHLQEKRLRHVSDAFKEDPLRVFRAAQFCARFNLWLDEETIALCQSLRGELATLSQERIFEEFKKLLLAKEPSRGLEVLRKTQALELFPELVALIGCPQDKEWHPEGDVWIHSLMVTDQAARLVCENNLDEEDKLIVVAGALCHDLGKPLTTIEKDGRIKSPGHDHAGEEPTRRFLTAIGYPKKYHDEVVALVKEHLKPYQLYRTRDEVSDSALRRLSVRVDIEKLLLVSKSDFLGRTTADALAGYDPSEPWLRQKMKQILGENLRPKPILLGRHLMALGEKPSSQFSQILSEAFEAQLDGVFADETAAISWLKARLKNPF